MSEILQHITSRHIKKVVREQKGTPVFEALTKGWERNLDKDKSRITEPVFWSKMVRARLTTQTPVGVVRRFVQLPRFPLAYETVQSKRNVEHFIDQITKEHGFWLHRRIADDLATNLARLEKADGWKNVLRECNRLNKLTAATEKKRKETERAVANYIADTFKGFGPKQSRNLLQMLGLTRYETPIDSRVMKWLNQYLPTPAQLDPRELSGRKRYERILDDIQELCRKVKVYPRVFDAAVFSAMDRSQRLPPYC